MSQPSPLMPRQPVPDLTVDLVGGGQFRLADDNPDTFTLVVVYRGYHCPICKAYLGKLVRLLPDLAERGVKVVAMSSDPEDRAKKAQEDWKLGDLPLGYGLSLDTARNWGLYISTGRGKTSIGVEEPALFAEPGLFLVRADGTLFFTSVQSMPFLRPDLAALAPAIDFVLKNDYPARGEVAELPAAAE